MNTSASRPSLCIGILTLNEEERIVQHELDKYQDQERKEVLK